MTQSSLFPTIPLEVSNRIALALRDPEISSCAGAVLAKLQLCPEAAGRDRAISISGLQDYWRRMGLHIWSERMVKEAVSELRRVYRLPIGGARTEPYGYFIATSSNELDAAAQPIEAEIIALAQTLRAFKPASELSRVLCGQARLAE